MSTIPNEPLPIDDEKAAAAILIQVRQLTQSINGFSFSSQGRRRQITNSASVPDAFLQSVAIACDAAPELASAAHITSVELRKAIEFTRAYHSVADELELLAKGLRDTVAERRADVGRRALHVYNLAKSFNSGADRVVLIPHLKNMKRDLGKSRSKPATEQPEPSTPTPIKKA
jgi:hypothetical protein